MPTPGCGERVFTLGLDSNGKDLIVFIEDDDGMLFHYGEWIRGKPGERKDGGH